MYLIDASSKIPSGLLAGNLVDLGAYDECVELSVNSDGVSFTGKHCLVVMHLNFKSVPHLASPGVLSALGNSLAYTFALCLPSTCSSQTLEHSLATVAHDVNYFTSSENLTIEFTVSGSDCHTNVRPSLDASEVLGIMVTLGFVIVVIMSTIVDLAINYERTRVEPSKCERAIIAFSLYTNAKRLLNTSSSEDTIQVLHCLKFISIAWVVIGHRVKFTAQSPLSNLLKLASYIDNWSSMIILNATLSVDVFFVISGILNTYVYMNKTIPTRKSTLSVLASYVHRYVRLTPAYALMILVTATWLYRVGDGPVWDRLVGHARDDCVSYWWSSLLYINNYYNPNNNCLMQSWYLAADMQLFWLSPLVLYPLGRRPRVGLVILFVLIILSIFVPFLVAYDDYIKTPIPITFDTAKVDREMAELYLPTHTKTIAYVIGIIAGYVLYLVKNKKIQIKLQRVTNAFLWTLAVASMAWALFGGHSLFLLDSPYSRWQSSLYIGFYRLFWSAGIAWLILACTTGYGGFLNKIFSLPVWVPLGRLTYCIYLTHVAVILYSIGGMRKPQHFSYYNMILKFLGELIISTILAAILSLMIEAPLMVLEKVIFSPRRKRLAKRFSGNATSDSTTSIQLPKALNTA
ncbi:hypothetical protein J6590_003508 [Homalodisca vitripennis]|nr:hypothetical protein J6590_003508 [Homalodisca vitripennis]